MEAIIYGTIFGLAIVGLFVGWIETLYRDHRNERCPVCGYLKRGPLHDEKRCENRREIDELSDAEIRTRQIHRINKEELGF